MEKFDLTKVGETLTKEVGVENGLIEPSEIATTEEPFEVLNFVGVSGGFPPDSFIYFGENYELQKEDGSFYTSDQGYGRAGKTDSDGKMFFDPFKINGLDMESGLLNIDISGKNINII